MLFKRISASGFFAFTVCLGLLQVAVASFGSASDETPSSIAMKQDAPTVAAATPTPPVTASPTPPAATATPTATSSPVSLGGFSNAPGGILIPAPIAELKSLQPVRPILFVSIAGQDLSNLESIDPRVSYAFRSFGEVFAKYGVTVYSYKSIDSTGADAQTYCASLSGAPLEIVNIEIPTSTANRYTSGLTYKVSIHGQTYRCVGSRLTPSDDPVFDAQWSHTYIPNPFEGLYNALALVTSPFVNKYKLFLTVPATLVGSFEHDQDAEDGVIYCAVAAAVADYLRNDADQRNRYPNTPPFLQLPSPLPSDAPNFYANRTRNDLICKT